MLRAARTAKRGGSLCATTAQPVTQWGYAAMGEDVKIDVACAEGGHYEFNMDTKTIVDNEKRRLIRSAIKALAAVIDNKSFTLPHTCLQYLIPFSVVAKNLKFHQNCTCGSN